MKKFYFILLLVVLIVTNVVIFNTTLKKNNSVEVNRTDLEDKQSSEYQFSDITNKDINYDFFNVNYTNKYALVSNISEIKENRGFYDDEKKRILKLKESYYNGTNKPFKKIYEQDGSGLYFDSSNNTINYPERSMTDEELLSLIDFNAIINVYLSQNRPSESESQISAEKAKNISKKALESFYNKDISEFNCEYALNKKDNFNSLFYTISYENNGVIYFSDINADNGKLLNLSLYDHELLKNNQSVNKISKEVSENFKNKSINALKRLGFEGKYITQYIPKLKGKSIYTVFDCGDYICEIELSYPKSNEMEYLVYQNKEQAKKEINNKALKYINN